MKLAASIFHTVKHLYNESITRLDMRYSRLRIFIRANFRGKILVFVFLKILGRAAVNIIPIKSYVKLQVCMPLWHQNNINTPQERKSENVCILLFTFLCWHDFLAITARGFFYNVGTKIALLVMLCADIKLVW